MVLEIAVVSHDLMKEQTLEDMVASLQHLDDIVNRTFSRLTQRVDVEVSRVKDIQTRIDQCQSKVEKVRGSSQATTVFSTASFPTEKDVPLADSVLDLSYDPHEIPNPYPEPKDGITYEWAQPQSSQYYNEDLLQDLTVLYSRMNLNDHEEKRVEFLMEEQGLGSLPPHISSVGSLLLFNSDVNPYKNYEARDNLESTGKSREVKRTTKEELHDAPKSLIDGDALPEIAGLDLTYKPKVGVTSDFAAPSDLPLDFLADIRFEAALPAINPSAGLTSDLPPPPTLDRVPVTKAPSSPMKSPAPSSSSSGDAPPPPPPPPPPGPTDAGASAPPPPPPPPSSEVQDGGPPPPPLPPQQQQQQQQLQEAHPVEEEPVPQEDTPPPTSDSVSFLDQIKQMDVTKLRSREEAQMSQKKRAATQKQHKEEPMSMADELMARLKRRAGVFSGKTDKRSSRRDSLIVRDSIVGSHDVADDVPEGEGGAQKRTLPTLFGAVGEDGATGSSEDDMDDRTVSSDGTEASELSVDDPMAGRSTVPKASAAKQRSAPKVALPPRPKSPTADKPSPLPDNKRQSMAEAANDTKSDLAAMLRARPPSDDEESEESDWDD